MTCTDDHLPVVELERRMRPRVYSGGGFLGPTESLEAVLTQDCCDLEEAGITFNRLADALECVLQLALDQRSELLRQLHKAGPEPGKLRTAKEIALRSDLSPEFLRISSEFENRDVHMPDLRKPELVPKFSIGNLPDSKTGYLVNEMLQVFFNTFRGMQECPWGCGCTTWACWDFLIVNRRSGEYLTGPGLIVHLVREHQFFEGHASPYRVDPLRAIRVLELNSGEDVSNQ